VIASQESTLAWLHRRHETLCRVEQGGWWRLRGLLLPLLTLAGRLRRLSAFTRRKSGHDSRRSG
jgi:hypothetical protein